MMHVCCRKLSVLLAAVVLFGAPLADAAAVQVRLYRGEVALSFTDPQSREDLLIRYRSRTRDTLRIGISELVLMNMQTGRRMRLPERTVRLENRVDGEGYWIADILYEGVNAGNDTYRVSGRVTQHLAGSVRNRSFRVYLEPEDRSRPRRRPPGSGIDWGLDE